MATAVAAQQTAQSRHYRRRQMRRMARRQKKIKLEKKKMTGFSFYLMLILALMKDALDALLGITLILSIAVVPLSVFIGFIFVLYFMFQGVKPSGRKAAVGFVTVVAETLPLVSAVPFFTLSFIMVRLMENREIAKRNAKKRQQIKAQQRMMRKAM